MLIIDGSQGEGGGQVLRSALALSMWTGRPFQMVNIRAGRKPPGLKKQHLTSALAAQRVSCAAMQGATVGSRELVFEPSNVNAGVYEFDIGTAGSTTLVLQTILPPLLCAAGPSQLTLVGGTHNSHAPPYDFLAEVYLPLVNRMGPRVTSKLQRAGFFPAGGGRLVVEIQPAERLVGFQLLERGELLERRAVAACSRLPLDIAQRELRAVAERLKWPATCLHAEEWPTSGPGNIVMLKFVSQHAAEIVSGFGQRGVKAERVAEGAVNEISRYIASAAPVGEHLADQLLLPLALSGGGRFVTLNLSSHATTHIELIRRFLDVDVQVETMAADLCQVTVGAAGPG